MQWAILVHGVRASGSRKTRRKPSRARRLRCAAWRRALPRATARSTRRLRPWSCSRRIRCSTPARARRSIAMATSRWMPRSCAVTIALRRGCGAARVRNPVLVARCVMERTPHVMLAGEGALHFARAEGFADYDPLTRRAHDAWLRNRAMPAGTVGAVALDCSGHLAAATSTGGVTLKLPGRVGDSPIPGAGNYAHAAAACSATGRGELMMRVLAAKDLCDRVARGEHPQAATEALLRDMAAGVGAEAGFILLSRAGELGVTHGTASMPHAWWREGEPGPTARIRC